MKTEEAYKKTLDEIEKCLKGIHYPSCDMEKLYRNCGLVETIKHYNFSEHRVKDIPFTAEKQLSLIKWLGELDMLEIMRTTREDKAWIINSEYGMSGNVYKHTSRMKSFEDALASLINSLWQSLTEEDRKQVKGILE